MSDPRLCGFLKFYNETTRDPLHLPRCLASLAAVCGRIVMFDDSSTDGSGETAFALAEKYGIADITMLRSDSTDWLREIEHKQTMLDRIHATPTPPEWIVWLDADECLSRNAAQDLLLHCQRDNPVLALNIRQYNLWRSRDHVRVDRPWAGSGFVRVWKYAPEMKFEVRSPRLHANQYPEGYAQRMMRLDPKKSVVVHFASDTREKVMAKCLAYRAAGDLRSAERMDVSQDGQVESVDRSLLPEGWWDGKIQSPEELLDNA